MKLVESYGHVWRLTNAAYIKMLEGLADCQEVDLNVLGKHLGAIECPCIASMTAREATELLAELKEKP